MIRHIPFWAIPMGLICVEIAILLWVKELKRRFYFVVALGLFFLTLVIFYYWQGGPGPSVNFFLNLG
jgi:hypothetical protein